MTEGEPIPDLTLAGADGPVRLSDYRGRPLVIYFYPKDDTAGCTREAGDFSQLLPDFAAAGIAVLGVSKDSPERHAKFAAKHGLTVPLASDDADGTVLAAFGAWVEKSLYGRKYMGIDRSTFLFGADGRLVRAWRKVRVPGHAAQVLAAARELPHRG